MIPTQHNRKEYQALFDLFRQGGGIYTPVLPDFSSQEICYFANGILEYALVEKREEGLELREIEIARTALADGMSFATIQKLTGLDNKTIELLNGRNPRCC